MEPIPTGLLNGDLSANINDTIRRRRSAENGSEGGVCRGNGWKQEGSILTKQIFAQIKMFIFPTLGNLPVPTG
jgi:hypothetical protein